MLCPPSSSAWSAHYPHPHMLTLTVRREGALCTTHSDANRPFVRRQQYVRVVFVQALQGLHFLHSQNILHQSLGANSVLVSSTSEQDVATLSVRLQVVPRARLTCTPGFVWG